MKLMNAYNIRQLRVVLVEGSNCINKKVAKRNALIRKVFAVAVILSNTLGAIPQCSSSIKPICHQTKISS